MTPQVARSQNPSTVEKPRPPSKPGSPARVIFTRLGKKPPSFITSSKILGSVAAIIIAFAGIALFAATIHPQDMDYISYWSAGKLLFHRLDPYSPSSVLALQKVQGLPIDRPRIMLNPPWSLFLAIPLGLGGIRTGLFLWTLAAIACILLSAKCLSTSSNNSLIGLTFAPALACLFSGQSSPFLLLGYALFLHLHRTRPFLAGASLLLMAIKPHLFLIFWIILLIDCLYRRKFGILVGAATALALSSAFATAFDPHVFSEYLLMLREYRPGQGFLPTISMLFRMSIDISAYWLLFVPLVAALIWSLWYYAKNRRTWDWRTHGLLLMLVIILFSPYAWLSDQIVLLPSILFALDPASEIRKNPAYPTWIYWAINAVILLTLVFGHTSLTSRAYLWTPLAWLIWFLYATQKSALHNLKNSTSTEAKITQAASQ